MAKAPPRVAIQGPAFIRLLARLAAVQVPAPSAALPERLGQWVDWNRAVTLARALDGRLPEPPDGPALADGQAQECARVRATLVAAIADETRFPSPRPGADGRFDFAPFGQHYLSLQRAMATATGKLRGQLRDLLGHRGPELARLAEVDAVMEMTLSPREQKLLAGVPALLGRHFDQLQPVTDAAAPGLLPAADGSWLSLFRKDMQAALMAELDVRFKPIDALLAALRPR